MNKTILAAVLSVITISPAVAATDSCAEQRNDISMKLAAAENKGDTASQTQLESALSQVNAYCTEERQAIRAAQELNKKQRNVKKDELDLEEAKAELAEARESGEHRKIAKKERKIKEKELDLEETRAELKQAQDDFNRLVK
ncbi:TPA: DUF1090 family protein [Morganella morganii]|nr:DUF1090 family protein [Morganella morganii]